MKFSILYNLLFLLILCSVSQSNSEDAIITDTLFNREVTSSVIEIRKTNDTFDRTFRTTTSNYFLSNYPGFPLYEVSITETFMGGGEGSKGDVIITKWDNSNNGNRSISWMLKSPGHSVADQGNLIMITEYGCCDGETVYKYFNSINSSKFLESTSDLIWLKIPGYDNERVISYRSLECIDMTEREQYGDNLMGMIDWSTPKSKLLSIAVVVNLDIADFEFTPRIKALSERDSVDAYYERLATDSLRQSLPVIQYVIHLQYYPDEVLIPIINGIPDIRYAVCPDSLQLILHKPKEEE